MKLFGIVFLKRFYNHLTGMRIVARFAAVATTPRTRLSPWLPTTTRLRFLLDLHHNLSLTLQILCVLYRKRSSLSEPLFLSSPALAECLICCSEVLDLCLQQCQLMHDPRRPFRKHIDRP
jgi:hypothetical protein